MAALEFSKPTPEKLIRQKAMDLLARREHSKLELRNKLRQRFSEQDHEIDLALDRLAAENLQSDQRFAESFVRSRAAKGQGPQRILAELQQRGVDGSISELSVQNNDVDWYALAADVLQKKYPTITDDYSEIAKRSRFLQYRGFSSEHIKAAFNVQKNCLMSHPS